MKTTNLVKQEHIKEVSAQQKKKSDSLMNYFLISFFITGLLLAFYHGTWLIAIGAGGLSIVAYYTSKFILPGSNLYQYVLSAAFGVFMTQYIYQMHGMFEMHFIAFIGSAILIIYQNWKLQIPLAIVVLLHHAVFGYLQFTGFDEIYFTPLEHMTLQTVTIHLILTTIIFSLCGLWAYKFKRSTNNNISQSFEIGRLQEADKQKEVLVSMSENIRISNERLTKAHGDLETLFENIEEVFFSIEVSFTENGPQFKPLQMSAACEKVYGYPADAFIKNPTLWRDIVLEGDKIIIDGHFLLLLQGKSIEHENRIRHSNGDIRWIQTKITPILNEEGSLIQMDGITNDITEKNLVKESLQKSEANLRTIFDNTDTGYLLIDTDLKVISFNEQAGKFAKQDLNQIFAEGDYTIDYFVPERKMLLKRMMEDALHGKNTSYESGYPQQDGSVRWYSIHLFGVSNKEGNIFALTLSINEINERKLAEDELNQLNRTLKKRAAELAVSNQELERFAYVTSHDLQEPLRMVSSFLQLLQKKYNHQLDETAQKYINFAVGGADRMKTLILDLLEFSRITTVKKEYTLINLNELVNKTLHILHNRLVESQASVTVGKFPEVYGNESQLMQVFENLTSNALKYSRNFKPMIELGFTEKNDVWEFFVKDNGIGIDAVHFDKIFVIFQRLHNRNEYSGTGIGLAICKKIVELHEGKIWVESSKEKGSTFYFTIPKFKQPILKPRIINLPQTN